MLNNDLKSNLDRKFVGRGLEWKRRRQPGAWADSRLVTNGIKGKQNRESVY